MGGACVISSLFILDGKIKKYNTCPPSYPPQRGGGMKGISRFLLSHDKLPDYSYFMIPGCFSDR
jgi:hypothetical protein